MRGSIRTVIEDHPLLFIAIIAGMTRLAVLPMAMKQPVGEGLLLIDAARNISDGNGLMLSGELLDIPPGASEIFRRTLKEWDDVNGIWGVVPPDQPTAFLPPLYPILLSLGLRIGGGILTLRILNIILGIMACVGAGMLAKSLAGRTAAIIAGILTAIHPMGIYQSAEISTHQLAALTLLLPLILLSGNRGFVRCLVAGIFIGLAFLARPTAWMLLPFVCVWILWWKKPVRALSGVLLGSILVCTPWVVRNVYTVGEPLIFTTNGGRNLWEFNNQKMGPEYEWSEPQVSRYLYDPIRSRFVSGSEPDSCLPFPKFKNEPEWVRNETLTRRFFCFLRRYPGAYVQLVGVRITQILGVWTLHDRGVSRYLFTLFLLPFLILGISGAWMGFFKGGISRIIALFIFAFLALHAATAAGLVYRGMIIPLLSISAAILISPAISSLHFRKTPESSPPPNL